MHTEINDSKTHENGEKKGGGKGSVSSPDYGLHKSLHKPLHMREYTRAGRYVPGQRGYVAPSVNNTGLPDRLKSGMERTTGFNLDHVRVHRNSAKPAAVGAHAYAQGGEIHLGAGQERHLPHELGHVVQQMRGEVGVTKQFAGVGINDDVGLERGADRLGEVAFQLGTRGGIHAGSQVLTQPIRGSVSLTRSNSSTGIQQHVKKGPSEKVGVKETQRYIEGNNSFLRLTGLTAIVGLMIKGVPNHLKTQSKEDLKIIKAYVADARKALTKMGNIIGTWNKTGERTDKVLIEHYNNIKYYVSKALSKKEHMKSSYKDTTHVKSAEGRAHSIAVTIGGKKPSSDYTGNNHFFKDLSIDSETFESDKIWKVNKINVPASPASKKGKWNTLTGLETTLSKPQAKRTATYTKAPKSGGRVGGAQQKAMGGVNAQGYAELAKIEKWGQQQWEWLHIRGDALGGSTDSRNLVAGTRDANTHMIPFENNISNLAKAIPGSKYKNLIVNWTLSDKLKTVAHHAFRTLRMEWVLNHKNNSSKNISGKVTFKPLDVTQNISKTEVARLQSILVKHRNKRVT